MSEKNKEPKKPYAYHQLRSTRKFPESGLTVDQYDNSVDYSLQAWHLTNEKRDKILAILSKATDEIEAILS